MNWRTYGICHREIASSPCPRNLKDFGLRSCANRIRLWCVLHFFLRHSLLLQLLMRSIPSTRNPCICSGLRRAFAHRARHACASARFHACCLHTCSLPVLLVLFRATPVRACNSEYALVNACACACLRTRTHFPTRSRMGLRLCLNGTNRET